MAETVRFAPLDVKTGKEFPSGHESFDPDLLLLCYDDVTKIPGTYDDVQETFRIDAECFIPDDLTYALAPKDWELLYTTGYPGPEYTSLSTIFLGRDPYEMITDTPDTATAAIVYKRAVNKERGKVEPSQMQITWLGETLGGNYIKSATYDMQSGEALALAISVDPKLLLPEPTGKFKLADKLAYMQSFLKQGPHEIIENIGIITPKMMTLIRDSGPRILTVSRDKETGKLSLPLASSSTYFERSGFFINEDNEYYTIQHQRFGAQANFPRSLPFLN